jgi:hypothetical protein
MPSRAITRSGQAVDAFARQHPDREERRGDRHRGDAHPARHHPLAGRRRHPGRAREEQGAERPGDVEEAAFDVGALRRLEQVGDVGDGQDDDARPEQRPGGAGAPAGEGGGGDDQREQRQVADRIGEVGGDFGARAFAGRGGDRPQRERRGQRGDGEPGDQPVEPARGGEVPDPLAQEHDQARVGERVEEQVSSVRGRGDRHRAGARERRQVIDFAAGPEQQAGADQEPGGPLPAHQHRPRQARGRGTDHDAAVDPGAEQRGRAVPGGRGDREGDERQREDDARDAQDEALIGSELCHGRGIYRAEWGGT